MAADLGQSGIEVEGFVERGAAGVPSGRRWWSRRCLASAGTNIKVLEAMAMGKAVVSTPAGVNGLEPEGRRGLRAGADGRGDGGGDRAAVPADRASIELAARRRVEREFSWDAIASAQAALYRETAQI